jgi:branched-subunit amino acid ABC-type transport system permease component
MGIAEAISVYFTGPAYREVVGLVLFILVLLYRSR